MPTGYTACVDDGATLSEYAYSCARNYWRDAPVEELVPDPFYEEQLLKAEAHVREMEVADPVQAYEKFYQESIKDQEKYRQQKQNEIAKYAAMRKQVQDWFAPPLLGGLKELMLSQLNVGQPDDADYSCHERMDPQVWYSGQIAYARNELKYAKKALRKHLAQVAEGNAFLAALKQEFPR